MTCASSDRDDSFAKTFEQARIGTFLRERQNRLRPVRRVAGIPVRAYLISTGQEWEYGDPKYEALFPDPPPDSADGLLMTLFFRAADACSQCGGNCLRTGSGSIAIRVDHEC